SVPEAHDQPDFAEAGETHGQRKSPVGGVPHRHRPVGRARDQRDQRFHSDMRPFQGDGVSRSVLQDKAVSLQIPILFQQAAYRSLILEVHFQELELTVRSFWKFISKNWKFSFEEQRTSNGVSISSRTTARLIDKRPGKTIRKAGKFFNERKYKSL